MPERRAGLQKKVSSIFSGVPIQKTDGAQQVINAPEPPRPEYVPPQPTAPSHMAPETTKPETRQPVQAPPKTSPSKLKVKQPKAEDFSKTQRQIPWQQTWQKITDKLFTPKPGVSTSRQKTTAILVPVLFIVLLFAFIKVFRTPAGKGTEPQGLEQKNASAASNKINWQIPEPYPTTLRDPMQFGSITTNRPETGKIIVKGIVYSKDNPSAVIADRIVHEGDKVLDATVIKINKDSVEFEMNNERWTQKVQQ
ncbi:MAG: hypothetical protein AMJ43_07105 [Coxiella sp. DG_40]|nr:MAG: hypothetical protein AMJ43_07105 [Coxiella sp. DG_40]